MFKAKVIVYLSQTQTQTTFYFSNHMIMKQGNTCTYINGLTNNNNRGDSSSLKNSNIEQENKNINKNNKQLHMFNTRSKGV